MRKQRETEGDRSSFGQIDTIGGEAGWVRESGRRRRKWNNKKESRKRQWL